MNEKEKFAVESMAGLAIKALDLQVITHQEFIENFKPSPDFLSFIAKMSREVEKREPGALAALGLAAEEPASAAEEEDGGPAAAEEATAAPEDEPVAESEIPEFPVQTPTTTIGSPQPPSQQRSEQRTKARSNRSRPGHNAPRGRRQNHVSNCFRGFRRAHRKRRKKFVTSRGFFSRLPVGTALRPPKRRKRKVYKVDSIPFPPPPPRLALHSLENLRAFCRFTGKLLRKCPEIVRLKATNRASRSLPQPLWLVPPTSYWLALLSGQWESAAVFF